MSCSEVIIAISITVASLAIWLWSDAITVEAPFIVPFVPEGWRLTSYFTFTKGISTAALFILPFFERFGLKWGNMICFGMGLFFSITLIFSWDSQLNVFGEPTSLYLFINSFVLMGLDSCRMTLLYMYVTEYFHPKFLLAVLIGDGLGGLIASIITYVQGYKQLMGAFAGNVNNGLNLTKDFLFGPSIGFAIITCVFFVCTVALLLSFTYARNSTEDTLYDNFINKYVKKTGRTSPVALTLSSSQLRTSFSLSKYGSVIVSSASSDNGSHESFFVVVWFFASASVFTLMPAFHSFSTIPYGQACYIFSVACWSIAFPCSAIICYMIKNYRYTFVSVILLLHIVIDLTLIYISLQSPKPILGESFKAQSTLVIMWFTQGFSGFFLFSISSYYLRQCGPKAIKSGSIAAQCGDVVGALLSFYLVNFSGFFHDN